MQSEATTKHTKKSTFDDKPNNHTLSPFSVGLALAAMPHFSLEYRLADERRSYMPVHRRG